MTDLFRIEITADASADLTWIFSYIAQDSAENAASVIGKILAAIDSLDELPHRCKVHRAHRNPVRVVRSMIVPPYIAYYRIREAEKVVQVLAIRHTARRQPRRFNLRDT